MSRGCLLQIITKQMYWSKIKLSVKLLRCSIRCGTGPHIFSGLNQVCTQNNSVAPYAWTNGVCQIILPAT